MTRAMTEEPGRSRKGVGEHQALWGGRRGDWRGRVWPQCGWGWVPRSATVGRVTRPEFQATAERWSGAFESVR